MVKKKQPSSSDRTLGRKSDNLPIRERILIICESQQTEPNYFAALRRDYGLTSIEIEKGKGGNSCKVLEEIKNNIKKWKSDYDQIWYVFDTEDLTNPNQRQILSKTLDLLKEVGIEETYAYSNPSFEYWFLLHFTYTNGLLHNSKAVEQELEKYIPNYEKSIAVFDLVKHKTDKAIENAKQCLIHHESMNNGTEPWANPSTRVHRLVEKLKKMKR